VNPPWFSGIDPVQYRLETVFGPRSSWPSINPMDLAPAYNAFDGRMAVYAGGLAGWGGETDIGTWNLAFHQRLEQAGVDHRWCGGQGSHDWTWWKRHLRDFVAYAYGTTPSSCPN
jgi:S-formylglutathione hydrolase FrmB